MITDPKTAAWLEGGSVYLQNLLFHPASQLQKKTLFRHSRIHPLCCCAQAAGLSCRRQPAE